VSTLPESVSIPIVEIEGANVLAADLAQAIERLEV
jgi:hypothetical protein